MNVDDLMEVWRSQDASPLHGVNDTLLRLALRQDEAKLRAQRRTEEWRIYFTSAVLVAFMAVFFVMIFGMLFYNDDDVITGWDFVMPIVGAAAVVFMSVHLYVTRRAQAQHEQRFGESLRDQLGRRIAQLDDQATRAVRVPCVQLIAILVGGMALFLAGIRVNLEPNEPFDRWGSVIRMILVFAILFVAAVWAGRRSVHRDVLPRKRRLEALLKELDT